MTDKRRICCMFEDMIPGHAADNRNLEYLASEDWAHREYRLYRCRRCGAYVMYEYTEEASYGRWDDLDIREYYFPVEAPDGGDRLDRYPDGLTVIREARYLYTAYREAQWNKDRVWKYGGPGEEFAAANPE